MALLQLKNNGFNDTASSIHDSRASVNAKVNLFSARGKTIHRRGAEALRKNNGL